MTSYDNTVKLARAIRVGDVLVAVSAEGERLCRVREVAREDGQIVVVHEFGSARFKPRDAVRVAHPEAVGGAAGGVDDNTQAIAEERPSVSVDEH